MCSLYIFLLLLFRMSAGRLFLGRPISAEIRDRAAAAGNEKGERNEKNGDVSFENLWDREWELGEEQLHSDILLAASEIVKAD